MSVLGLSGINNRSGQSICVLVPHVNEPGASALALLTSTKFLRPKRVHFSTVSAEPREATADGGTASGHLSAGRWRVCVQARGILWTRHIK